MQDDQIQSYVSIDFVQLEEGVQDDQIQSYDRGEVIKPSINEPLRTNSLRERSHEASFEVSRSNSSRNMIVPIESSNDQR